jgi:hypothetical protein
VFVIQWTKFDAFDVISVVELPGLNRVLKLFHVKWAGMRLAPVSDGSRLNAADST